MKYTNKNNLPEAIVKAIVNDEYSAGGADYTASTIKTPPQIFRLKQIYADEVTMDVSDMIFALLGTSVHYILEKSDENSVEKTIAFLRQVKDRAKYAVENNLIEEALEILSSEELISDTNLHLEKRLYANLGKIVIGGKPDWYDEKTKTIQDYKVTSVWKVRRKNFDDWISQLNIYKLLLESNGYEVEHLQIVAILKDWKPREAKYNEDYPNLAVQVIDLPVKDSLEVLSEVIYAVKRFEEAKTISSPKELYEKFPCSLEDKWGEEKFKVWKKGNSRATKVFNNRNEADVYCNNLNITNNGNYEVKIDAEYRRCEEYCPVKDFCYQYKVEHSQIAELPEPLKTEIPEKIDGVEITVKVRDKAEPKTEVVDGIKVTYKEKASPAQSDEKKISTEERVKALLSKTQKTEPDKNKSISELFNEVGL